MKFCEGTKLHYRHLDIIIFIKKKHVKDIHAHFRHYSQNYIFVNPIFEFSYQLSI